MMNFRFLYSTLAISLFLLTSCTSNGNDPEFLNKVEGRYLYTADEVLKVHSKDNELLMNWRGANAIKPSKLNEDTFYVKEMNAKIQFLTNPNDQKLYLVFVPKDTKDSIKYIHKKLDNNEKTPSEYLANNEYEKALEGYLTIKKQDSMSPLLNHWDFNRQGYRYLRNDSIEKALMVFKINAALNPKISNVYDSLGEAYLKSKDTANALTNYKKALEYDSGNRRIKRRIEKLENKEAKNSN